MASSHGPAPTTPPNNPDANSDRTRRGHVKRWQKLVWDGELGWDNIPRLHALVELMRSGEHALVPDEFYAGAKEGCAMLRRERNARGDRSWTAATNRVVRREREILSSLEALIKERRGEAPGPPADDLAWREIVTGEDFVRSFGIGAPSLEKVARVYAAGDPGACEAAFSELASDRMYNAKDRELCGGLVYMFLIGKTDALLDRTQKGYDSTLEQEDWGHRVDHLKARLLTWRGRLEDAKLECKLRFIDVMVMGGDELFQFALSMGHLLSISPKPIPMRGDGGRWRGDGMWW